MTASGQNWTFHHLCIYDEQMSWKRLDTPSKRAWKELLEDFEREHRFKFTRKPRFFVDENLGSGTTDYLCTQKKNVTDVWNENMLGKGDEHIWRFCYKNRRILLTHDDDFINERKFPIRRCYGLVVFPHAEGGAGPFLRKLVNFISVVDTGAGFMYQRKLIIRENGHWELFIIGESGKIERTLYDLNDRNHVFELG